ncbi:hypothetical protein K144312032_04530 [Clostridium tetani]|uniref:hypothetical protein n=1 Tax=Clostridium tetani TaxID=1513 RepID=UPI0024A87EFB|nr:hypothetical protein [Clostridium tetani]BDR66225.1 hypothetical protein K144312032_04530 [Clostridium tetani]
MKDEKNLKYSLPNNRKNKETGEKEEDSEFSLRDIVKATSNSKTDFMYSVILNKLEKDMLPDYIEGGLKWLMKK